MPPLRLIYDEPARGDWNMAVDEALAASVAGSGTPAFRCYAWQPATLSLGYFQRLDERAAHAPSADCPLVRRPSGGGAILHHHDLTYSLILPAMLPEARNASALYRLVHEALIAALANWNVTAEIRTTSQPMTPEPFLCFQRRASGDVLCGGEKICGSAQRRHRGAVAQHGSVLLATSTYAPEVPGVREITGHLLRPDELAAPWQHEVAKRLHTTIVADHLTAEEHAAAETLRHNKYATPAWTAKR